MAFEIKWTEFAIQQLQDILEYYKLRAGKTVAEKLVRGLVNSTLSLKSQPLIGQIEELLLDRNLEFRYFLHNNYKLIYWVNVEQNQIEIIDVYDTRLDPIKI